MIDREPEELAESVAELPEWDRIAVRDYYDALVTEVLGSDQPTPLGEVHRDVPEPSGEVLPLFAEVTEQSRSPRPGNGEAA